MNAKDRAILLGLVFGDGYLSKNDAARPGVLSIKHAEKQRPYAEFKARLVTNVLGGKLPTVRTIDNSGYPGCVFQKTDSYFRVLRDWIYVNGQKKLSPYIKWLTPEALAIWYMDDGGLGHKKRNGKVHAVQLYINCYTDRVEAERICTELKAFFDVQFLPSKGKGKYRIYCGTREARKFARIVAPFMPGSMLYKLAIPEEPTSARQAVSSAV